jgi:hypothetical protein
MGGASTLRSGEQLRARLGPFFAKIRKFFGETPAEIGVELKRTRLAIYRDCNGSTGCERENVGDNISGLLRALEAHRLPSMIVPLISGRCPPDTRHAAKSNSLYVSNPARSNRKRKSGLPARMLRNRSSPPAVAKRVGW